jgi:hypothetical protein
MALRLRDAPIKQHSIEGFGRNAEDIRHLSCSETGCRSFVPWHRKATVPEVNDGINRYLYFLVQNLGQYQELKP